MKKYDAIIIGFGKGGKTLAAEFAKRQKTVAIVERSDRISISAVFLQRRWYIWLRKLR